MERNKIQKKIDKTITNLKADMLRTHQSETGKLKKIEQCKAH